jgi:transcriptional regulator with XRE-family HTH domain
MYPMANRDIHRAGIFVQARRGEMGLTQEQLARAAGVDEKTVRTLEAGTTWPWPKNRTRIEQALGWTPLALERIASQEELEGDLAGAYLNLSAITASKGERQEGSG